MYSVGRTPCGLSTYWALQASWWDRSPLPMGLTHQVSPVVWLQGLILCPTSSRGLSRILAPSSCDASLTHGWLSRSAHIWAPVPLEGVLPQNSGCIALTFTLSVLIAYRSHSRYLLISLSGLTERMRAPSLSHGHSPREARSDLRPFVTAWKLYLLVFG